MNDAESTMNGPFSFVDAAAAERQELWRDQLLERLTTLIQTCEGCEHVRAIDVTRFDWPDKDGCNWSRSIVLDPAGVAPEVYSLAYGSVIETARESWNLK